MWGDTDLVKMGACDDLQQFEPPANDTKNEAPSFCSRLNVIYETWQPENTEQSTQCQAEWIQTSWKAQRRRFPSACCTLRIKAGSALTSAKHDTRINTLIFAQSLLGDGSGEGSPIICTDVSPPTQHGLPITHMYFDWDTSSGTCFLCLCCRNTCSSHTAQVGMFVREWLKA